MLRRFYFWFLTLPGLFLPLSTHADVLGGTETGGFLRDIGEEAGYKTVDPHVLVARYINIFLQLVGAILVALLVYGGFLWMTAGGDQEKVKKATSTIKNAIIGLIIIVLAWSLSRFILTRLITATST